MVQNPSFSPEAGNHSLSVRLVRDFLVQSQFTEKGMRVCVCVCAKNKQKGTSGFNKPRYDHLNAATPSNNVRSVRSGIY